MAFKVENSWTTKAGLQAVCAWVHDSHRCGYVGVPKDHPLYGADYDKAHELCPTIDVHGGLTFAASRGDYPIESELHWFGFDCAHLGDATFGRCGPDEVLRSQKFVENECEALAKQLHGYSPSKIEEIR